MWPYEIYAGEELDFSLGLMDLYRRSDPLLCASEEQRLGLEEHVGEYRSEKDVRRLLQNLELRR